MEKEINELLEQLDSARKDTRVIDREKANNYYNAITDLQTQLKKQQEIIDKAIKYIKEEKKEEGFHNYLDDEDMEELLQILKDKEV